MTNPNKAELRNYAQQALSDGLGGKGDPVPAVVVEAADVLSLLDECDRKDSLLEEYKRGGRCALELLEDAEAERDAALADAKRLRREIKAFRNNSAISHAQMKWLDEILSKEAPNA